MYKKRVAVEVFVENDESLELLKLLIDDIKKRRGLTAGEIFSLVEKLSRKEILLPISIFSNEELSCLETIVKYLKEELSLRFHEIAVLLDRNDRTIWTTYSIACKKRKEKLPVKESKFSIPASVFRDRKLSVLENAISYLKDNFSLRYSQISVLLNRDERNIWSVYSKALKKKNGK